MARSTSSWLTGTKNMHGFAAKQLEDMAHADFGWHIDPQPDHADSHCVQLGVCAHLLVLKGISILLRQVRCAKFVMVCLFLFSVVAGAVPCSTLALIARTSGLTVASPLNFSLTLSIRSAASPAERAGSIWHFLRSAWHC